MTSVITAPSLSERVYSGTHGNESVAEGYVTVNAAEQGSVVHLLSLPIGIRINALQLVSDTGLGGAAKISVKSGEQVLISDSGAVTPGFASYFPVLPYTTQKDDELVTVTVNDAEATGSVSVLLRYTVVGY